MFELMPFGRRNDLSRTFRDFERNFFRDFGFGAPEFRTDIKDKGDKMMMEADLPGFNKEDIKIDLHGNYLTISAERKYENDETDGDGNYLRRERSYGSFTRSFDVSGIDTDKIEGSYDKGVLKLTLPKKEATGPASKRIELR